MFGCGDSHRRYRKSRRPMQQFPIKRLSQMGSCQHTLVGPTSPFFASNGGTTSSERASRAKDTKPQVPRRQSSYSTCLRPRNQWPPSRSAPAHRRNVKDAQRFPSTGAGFQIPGRQPGDSQPTDEQTAVFWLSRARQVSFSVVQISQSADSDEESKRKPASGCSRFHGYEAS